MRAPRWLTPVMLILVAGCQSAVPATLSEQDKAAIRGIGAEFVKASNAHDMDAAVDRTFTTDAVRLPPSGPELSGLASIKKWLAAYPLYSDFAVRAVEIEGTGNWAYVRGRYSIKMATAPGAPMLPDSGKYLEIWNKHSDGSWHVARDIWNSDIPMPAPKTAEKKGASR